MDADDDVDVDNDEDGVKEDGANALEDPMSDAISAVVEMVFIFDGLID